MDQRRAVPRASATIHAILLGFITPLALAALLSDWRFSTTYEIQWLNMADWMVTGSLLGGGLALAWTLIERTVQRRWRDRPSGIALLLLVIFMIVQFINALTHAKDNYATMPMGLVLSLITTLIAIAAAWTGLRTINGEIVR